MGWAWKKPIFFLPPCRTQQVLRAPRLLVPVPPLHREMMSWPGVERGGKQRAGELKVHSRLVTQPSGPRAGRAPAVLLFWKVPEL